MAPSDPPPRESSTVVLMRDGPEGIELFMMLRNEGLDYASGALVFPGGLLDAADGDPGLRPRCIGAEGLDDTALAFRVAAIREAFEECGILLARPRGSSDLVDPTRLRRLEDRYRKALLHRELTLLDMVEREALELASDLLLHFAHWTTPVRLPRRFSTHFFLVAAPPDQVGFHDGRESVDSVWITPADACVETDAGKWLVMFPTRMNIERIGRSRTVAEAFAAAAKQPVVSVTPRMEIVEGGRIMHIPIEAGYGASELYDDGPVKPAIGYHPMSPEKIARLKRS